MDSYGLDTMNLGMLQTGGMNCGKEWHCKIRGKERCNSIERSNLRDFLCKVVECLMENGNKPAAPVKHRRDATDCSFHGGMLKSGRPML